MNKVLSNYINKIIANACLDERVDSGILDLNNFSHREIIAEQLIDLGLDVTAVMSIVNELAIRDGKYPDRQAYNKEGWLVTFPSPEYKQAAIKKGTHFTSDPTHGRGGMNIYYKRKGKQKRMTQQDTSAVEPGQPSRSSAPSPQQDAPQPPSPTDGQTPPEKNQDAGASVGNNSSLPQSGDDTPQDDGADEKTPQSAKDFEAGATGGQNQPPDKGGEQKPTDQPAAPPSAPPPPPPPSFVNISVEFAKGKRWNPTPYGEWRSAMGETAAIVALSGEVVPIKATDREELKLFAAKRQP